MKHLDLRIVVLDEEVKSTGIHHKAGIRMPEGHRAIRIYGICSN